jgi:hypothetical protein
MPSIADLVEEERLERLADPGAFRQGAWQRAPKRRR